MTVVTQTRSPFRVEDLLKPGMSEKFVEVIEGELVVMTPASRDHNEIGFNFQKLFDAFANTRADLYIGFDNDGFLIQRAPDVLLCPDASLFRKRPRSEGPWMEFSPEIAVEVVSPSNNPAELAFKRRKYFEAGSEQVWQAYPETGTIEFHFRDDRYVIAQGNEVIIGEGIAEGMEISLEKLFTLRRV